MRGRVPRLFRDKRPRALLLGHTSSPARGVLPAAHSRDLTGAAPGAPCWNSHPLEATSALALLPPACTRFRAGSPWVFCPISKRTVPFRVADLRSSSYIPDTSPHSGRWLASTSSHLRPVFHPLHRALQRANAFTLRKSVYGFSFHRSQSRYQTTLLLILGPKDLPQELHSPTLSL